LKTESHVLNLRGCHDIDHSRFRSPCPIPSLKKACKHKSLSSRDTSTS
ncbi:hypothetical protein AFLA70_813g000110, partial [Aspergillus flavus AF70]